MYLSGLSGTSYGVSQAACRAMGGQWQNANPNVPTFNPVGNCFTPDVVAAPQQQAAPSVSVNVPTNVNTNVSPQISPNLIQQQQPTNSPVNASTDQTSTPSQGNQTAPQASSSDAALQALLELMAAQNVPQIPQAPAISGGGPAILEPDPVPVQTNTIGDDFSKYLPFAVIAAGLAFFALNRKTQGK